MNMSATRFHKALPDVSKEFDDPAAILGAHELTRAQKIELLKQWEYDLRLELVASEENMPVVAPDESTPSPSGRSAELLREVRAALSKLDAAEEDGQGVTGKTGG